MHADAETIQQASTYKACLSRLNRSPFRCLVSTLGRRAVLPQSPKCGYSISSVSVTQAAVSLPVPGPFSQRRPFPSLLAVPSSLAHQDVDKLKGMKWLLAMVSKGRDVSEFFSDVVKNMAVRSVEVKKMVYIYLVHYADNDAQCRELALLSINSFQNDLRGSNQVCMRVFARHGIEKAP